MAQIAIERLHEEFKRRIKTQNVLPSADTAAMCSPPVRSTCASSTVGRRSPQNPSISRLTLLPETILHVTGECATQNSNLIPDGATTTDDLLRKPSLMYGISANLVARFIQIEG